MLRTVGRSGSRSGSATGAPCARALLLAAALVSADAACRRTVDERPVPALAGAPDLDARFDGLRARWLAADRAGRAALGGAFAALAEELERRRDGLEPLARAYLALCWLDADAPAKAEAVVRPLIEGPPGVPSELGALVKGAAARRLGRPREAIDLLRPLVGKMIDGFARPVVYEELCHAFLDDGRYEEGLAYAEGWLRSATGADKEAVRTAVERVIERVPDAVLLRILEADALAPPEARHSPSMTMLLSIRLERRAAPATTQQDAGAREAGSASAAADAGLAPPSLAGASPALPVRFDPRTIALLVPMTAPGWGVHAGSIARAAAAVASPALATALHVDAGVPLTPTSLEHRLTVIDSGGTAQTLSSAFDAAEREGAGVVVGGLFDAESNALATLAQARRVPTILLRRPSAPPIVPAGEKQAWIVLGPSLDEEGRSTMAIAQVAVSDAAVLEPWPVPGDASPPPADPLRARCDAQPKLAGAPAFPVTEWRARKVGSIVVLGDARCARRLADDVLAIKGSTWRPTLVLAPSALELAHVPLALPRTVVGAGLLPADDAAPVELRTLWRDQGGPVGFFSALGHDAATLAASALPGDLPPAVDAASMQKARAVTLARLFGAKAPLWTSTSSGPTAAGSLPQTTRLRAVSSGSALTPSWL